MNNLLISIIIFIILTIIIIYPFFLKKKENFNSKKTAVFETNKKLILKKNLFVNINPEDVKQLKTEKLDMEKGNLIVNASNQINSSALNIKEKICIGGFCLNGKMFKSIAGDSSGKDNIYLPSFYNSEKPDKDSQMVYYNYDNLDNVPRSMCITKTNLFTPNNTPETHRYYSSVLNSSFNSIKNIQKTGGVKSSIGSFIHTKVKYFKFFNENTVYAIGEEDGSLYRCILFQEYNFNYWQKFLDPPTGLKIKEFLFDYDTNQIYAIFDNNFVYTHNMNPKCKWIKLIETQVVIDYTFDEEEKKKDKLRLQPMYWKYIYGTITELSSLNLEKHDNNSKTLYALADKKIVWFYLNSKEKEKTWIQMYTDYMIEIELIPYFKKILVIENDIYAHDENSQIMKFSLNGNIYLLDIENINSLLNNKEIHRNLIKKKENKVDLNLDNYDLFIKSIMLYRKDYETEKTKAELELKNKYKEDHQAKIDKFYNNFLTDQKFIVDIFSDNTNIIFIQKEGKDETALTFKKYIKSPAVSEEIIVFNQNFNETNYINYFKGKLFYLLNYNIKNNDNITIVRDKLYGWNSDFFGNTNVSPTTIACPTTATKATTAATTASTTTATTAPTTTQIRYLDTITQCPRINIGDYDENQWILIDLERITFIYGLKFQKSPHNYLKSFELYYIPAEKTPKVTDILSYKDGKGYLNSKIEFVLYRLGLKGKPSNDVINVFDSNDTDDEAEKELYLKEKKKTRFVMLKNMVSHNISENKEIQSNIFVPDLRFDIMVEEPMDCINGDHIDMINGKRGIRIFVDDENNSETDYISPYQIDHWGYENKKDADDPFEVKNEILFKNRDFCSDDEFVGKSPGCLKTLYKESKIFDRLKTNDNGKCTNNDVPTKECEMETDHLKCFNKSHCKYDYDKEICRVRECSEYSCDESSCNIQNSKNKCIYDGFAEKCIENEDANFLFDTNEYNIPNNVIPRNVPFKNVNKDKFSNVAYNQPYMNFILEPARDNNGALEDYNTYFHGHVHKH